MLLIQAQWLSLDWLFVTLWTVAHQAPLAMDSPDKNTEVGCHFLLQGIFPNPGIESASSASPVLTGRFFTIVQPGKYQGWSCWSIKGQRSNVCMPTTLKHFGKVNDFQIYLDFKRKDLKNIAEPKARTHQLQQCQGRGAWGPLFADHPLKVAEFPLLRFPYPPPYPQKPLTVWGS